jgi:hypothetical protein
LTGFVQNKYIPKMVHAFQFTFCCVELNPEVAGFSSTEETRIIGTCLVTGHGAGAAAAVAVNSRETVKEIDRKKLRKTLEEQHVWFG